MDLFLKLCYYFNLGVFFFLDRNKFRKLLPFVSKKKKKSFRPFLQYLRNKLLDKTKFTVMEEDVCTAAVQGPGCLATSR